MSLKLRTPQKIILILIGISAVGFFLSSSQLNTCGIQHVVLVEDIKAFENNQDPEFCAVTVNKILEFNEQCEPYIEILDCG